MPLVLCRSPPMKNIPTLLVNTSGPSPSCSIGGKQRGYGTWLSIPASWSIRTVSLSLWKCAIATSLLCLIAVTVYVFVCVYVYVCM